MNGTNLKMEVAAQAYAKSWLASCLVTLENQRLPSGSSVIRELLILLIPPSEFYDWQKRQIKIRKTLGELTPWKQLYNALQETRIFDRWKDKPTWISQYTFGLGQPSGGWHVRRNGSPSATVKVFVGSSLKELSSAFLTNTELEVAMPHSFSAKHWYCPVK